MESAATIDVVNPATEEVIAQVEDGGADAVDAAVRDAHTAFGNSVWLDLGPAVRTTIMLRAADLIEEELEALAREEALSAGMPLWLGRTTILQGAAMFRYYAGAIQRISGQAKDVFAQGRLFHAYTRREPVGVTALITPWNAPIMLACSKLATALAAGCTVVLKPSEETPLTTRRIVDILQRAGVPEGVVNVVDGFGHTTGAALVDHPLVRKVSFTGSTAVGRQIVRASAGNLKRVTLELGGKSPVLVFDDADIDQAATAVAWGIFINTGQACIAGSRIFAQAKVYDALVAKVAEVGRAMKIGNGLDADTVLGPLVSARQLERVMAYVNGARDAGAHIVTGGSRVDRAGFFFEPTVVAEATQDMPIAREEVFGPVVAITRFTDEDEALTMANDTEYGLSSCIWTRDLSRAHRISRELQAGTVSINSSHMSDSHMPFGGYKQSGWGAESGDEGLTAYLQSKSVFAAL